jgi:D-mannonate dehydratase
MEGEDNTQPGYMMKGQIFAVGYMHGLIDAVRRRSAAGAAAARDG